MNYIITEEALLDLENIWLYTFKTWSKEQADRYFNLLVDEFEFIGLNPNSGKDYGKIREGYFRTQVKSHFIFYRINDISNEIEIIRILHQRMDVDSRLAD